MHFNALKKTIELVQGVFLLYFRNNFFRLLYFFFYFSRFPPPHSPTYFITITEYYPVVVVPSIKIVLSLPTFFSSRILALGFTFQCLFFSFYFYFQFCLVPIGIEFQDWKTHVHVLLVNKWLLFFSLKTVRITRISSWFHCSISGSVGSLWLESNARDSRSGFRFLFSLLVFFYYY